MTQTKDLIKKMADFFTSEEYYEKGEDARLELSPDDVRCMNEVIKACGNGVSRQAVKEQMIKYGFRAPDMTVTEFVEDLPPVKPQQEDIAKDGTLTVRVADGRKVTRVFVCGDNHFGGLYYPDEDDIGHWIDDTSLGYHVSICSNCDWRGHGDTCLIYKPKYCPNCGARMIEPQESEVKDADCD